MAKVTAEVAQAEVESWLDFKKILPKTREDYSDSVETIQSAIEEGCLVMDPDTHEFRHTLSFPLGEGDEVKHLTFRARLNDKMLSSYMKGVSATDVDERLIAIIAALTQTAKGIIKGLDSTDKRIARSIASFFI